MSKSISIIDRLLGGNVLTKTMCVRVRGAVSTAAPTSASQVRHDSTATFEIQPYKLYKLDKGPPQSVTISSEDAIKLYTTMSYARNIENATAALYKGKKIRGFCHLYSGQEAVAVGIRAVMRPQDTALTSYRCHVWTYLMNGTPMCVLAELTGRKSGCSRGKGGSMHMYGKNFYGGNGIVGAQVPLGAGLAFAHKYKGDGGVCFNLYGDGAANQGQLFEAFNMSKLWTLPCAYICENNKYGLGTSAERSSASTEYYKRGDYIPGIWVDGMDVLGCREAARFGIEWITSGKGPIIIEMETYRYHGHSMSDPGTSYRTREEVQNVRKTRDPITGFKDKIVGKKLATADQIKEIDKTIRGIVNKARKDAEADTEIGVEELSADIYVENLEGKIRGVRPDTPLTHVSLAKRN